MSYAQPITTRVQTRGRPRHTGTPPVQPLPLELSQHDVSLFPWSSSCRLGPKLWPRACLLHTFHYVYCLSPTCPFCSARGISCRGHCDAPWLPGSPAGGSSLHLGVLGASPAGRSQSLLCETGSRRADSLPRAALTKHHEFGGFKFWKSILSQSWRLEA